MIRKINIYKLSYIIISLLLFEDYCCCTDKGKVSASQTGEFVRGNSLVLERKDANSRTFNSSVTEEEFDDLFKVKASHRISRRKDIKNIKMKNDVSSPASQKSTPSKDERSERAAARQSHRNIPSKLENNAFSQVLAPIEKRVPLSNRVSRRQELREGHVTPTAQQPTNLKNFSPGPENGDFSSVFRKMTQEEGENRRKEGIVCEIAEGRKSFIAEPEEMGDEIFDAVALVGAVQSTKGVVDTSVFYSTPAIHVNLLDQLNNPQKYASLPGIKDIAFTEQVNLASAYGGLAPSLDLPNKQEGEIAQSFKPSGAFGALMQEDGKEAVEEIAKNALSIVPVMGSEISEISPNEDDDLLPMDARNLWRFDVRKNIAQLKRARDVLLLLNPKMEQVSSKKGKKEKELTKDEQKEINDANTSWGTAMQALKNKGKLVDKAIEAIKSEGYIQAQAAPKAQEQFLSDIQEISLQQAALQKRFWELEKRKQDIVLDLRASLSAIAVKGSKQEQEKAAVARRRLQVLLTIKAQIDLVTNHPQVLPVNNLPPVEKGALTISDKEKVKSYQDQVGELATRIENLNKEFEKKSKGLENEKRILKKEIDEKSEEKDRLKGKVREEEERYIELKNKKNDRSGVKKIESNILDDPDLIVLCNYFNYINFMSKKKVTNEKITENELRDDKGITIPSGILGNIIKDEDAGQLYDALLKFYRKAVELRDLFHKMDICDGAILTLEGNLKRSKLDIKELLMNIVTEYGQLRPEAREGKEAALNMKFFSEDSIFEPVIKAYNAINAIVMKPAIGLNIFNSNKKTPKKASNSYAMHFKVKIDGQLEWNEMIKNFEDLDKQIEEFKKFEKSFILSEEALKMEEEYFGDQFYGLISEHFHSCDDALDLGAEEKEPQTKYRKYKHLNLFKYINDKVLGAAFSEIWREYCNKYPNFLALQQVTADLEMLKIEFSEWVNEKVGRPYRDSECFFLKLRSLLIEMRNISPYIVLDLTAFVTTNNDEVNRYFMKNITEFNGQCSTRHSIVTENDTKKIFTPLL